MSLDTRRESSGGESSEEVVERVVEEGDLSGGRIVRVERVTVHRSVREFTPQRTPSEERLTREDSAYRSLGSRTSSVTSLASESLGESDHHPQWYQDYQHHAFGVRRDLGRSRSQFDSHIQEIKGMICYLN